MTPVRRRHVVAAGWALLGGGVNGCVGSSWGTAAGEKVPICGKNHRDEGVGLEHWVSVNGETVGGDHRSNLTRLEAGTEELIREVPAGDLSLTADLLHIKDQRNVLFQVDDDSDAFSTDGYAITGVSDPLVGVGGPKIVEHEATPGDASMQGDYIRIAPLSQTDEGDGRT